MRTGPDASDPVPGRPQRIPGLAFVLGSVLAVTLAPVARGNITDAPGADLRVSLYTYGPGEIYWERFGHDALVVTDTASGQSIAFNYGLFDFDQKDFFLNFARGRMTYMAAAWPASDDIRQYTGEGRWIVDQQLDLTPTQRSALRDFLVWNVTPENARYAYDYFTDNCTTRVRDALDRALGGALRAQLAGRPAPPAETYRHETDRLMSGQPWLMGLLDLGLGPFADQPLDQWRGAFLPAQLMRDLRSVRTTDGSPLVASEARVAEARLPAPPAAPPDLRWPFAIVGLLTGIGLVVSAALRGTYPIERWWFSAVGTVFTVLAGLAGTLMLVLWLWTAHRAAWANENLLLFSPLAWLLVPGLIRLGREGTRAGRSTVGVATFLALLAAFALASKALPWFPQQNLPWILFALPSWVGMAVGLWSARRLPQASLVRE